MSERANKTPVAYKAQMRVASDAQAQAQTQADWSRRAA